MREIARAVRQAFGAHASVGDDGVDWIPDSAIERVEDDRLGHRYLIDSLAALLLRGPSAGNVGVFGPWGSGKTSIARLLEARLLESDDPRIKFVYFDAWKYQETPLRRHFLQVATSQLNAKEARHFTDRLYSRRRTTDVDLGGTNWLQLALVVIAALVATTLLYVLVSLVAAAIASRTGGAFQTTFLRQLTRNAPTVLVSTAILAPLLTLLLNKWQTTWDDNEPSSAEQFDKAFRDLVSEALRDCDRVVFFIDELDRAPATAVVSALETMKTFLGVDGCIFVVAADQLVLEVAVKEEGSAVRSPDPKNPYYSTGSAYLDKIFGFRLHIPALPASRLAPFARELVASRGGTWATLGDYLDDVLSLLVPFHVQSPRRVKGLLNNYVLASRSVAANPDLRPRLAHRDTQVGLAKLVCLRTEFPLFYRTVEAMPRVMRALTEALEDREAARLRYDQDAELWAAVEDVLDRKSPPDVFLRDGPKPASDEQRTALSDQLLDYLRLSSEVVDFDPEIFYLEARGSASGLRNDQAHALRDAAFRGDAAAVEKVLVGENPRRLPPHSGIWPV